MFFWRQCLRSSLLLTKNTPTQCSSDWGSQTHPLLTENILWRKKEKKPASSTEVSAVSQFVTFYAISVLNFSLVGRVERAKLRFCVLNNNMERVLTLSYYSSDFNKTCAAPLVKAERSMVRWPCFTWENLLNRIFFLIKMHWQVLKWFVWEPKCDYRKGWLAEKKALRRSLYTVWVTVCVWHSQWHSYCFKEGKNVWMCCAIQVSCQYIVTVS